MSLQVEYRGDVTFQPVSEPAFGLEFFGMDGARLGYKGAAPLKKAFLDSLVKFTPLAGFPNLYLMASSDDEAPVFPEVVLSYIGFRGAIPPVKIEDGKSIQTATAGVTATSGDLAGKKVTIEMSYRASRTSYKWFETSAPAKESRYSSVRNQINPFDAIVTWRVSDEKGILQSVPLNTFIQLKNQFTPLAVVTDYKVEDLVPGKIWGCEATVDYCLQ